MQQAQRTCQSLNLLTLRCHVETKPVVKTTGPENTNQPSWTERMTSSKNDPIAKPAMSHPTNKSLKYICSDTPLERRPEIHNKTELIEIYSDSFDERVGCFENSLISLDPDAKASSAPTMPHPFGAEKQAWGRTQGNVRKIHHSESIETGESVFALWKNLLSNNYCAFVCLLKFMNDSNNNNLFI